MILSLDNCLSMLLIVNPRARMSKFVLGVSDAVFKKFRTFLLKNDMYICCLTVSAKK